MDASCQFDDRSLAAHGDSTAQWASPGRGWCWLLRRGIASAELYTQPTANLAVSPTSGFFHESLVITGTTLVPNEMVNIYVDITTTAPAYTATAGTDGSFVLATTVHQDTYGSHTLIAQGQSSGRFGATAFFESARLILTPNSGSVGSITALGFGFGAGEQAKVYWNNPRTLLGTATANSQGTFAGAAGWGSASPCGGAIRYL